MATRRSPNIHLEALISVLWMNIGAAYSDCKFAHVFSPFATSDLQELHEYRMAERSWLEAAETAKAEGISVDFVGIALDEDQAAVPGFARFIQTLSYISDRRGAHIPTIDGILLEASKLEAQYIIYTNWDIGVVPNFYSMACRLIADDPAGSIEFTRLVVPLNKNDPMETIPGALQKLRPASATEMTPVFSPGDEHAIPDLMSMNFHKRVYKHPGHDCFIMPKSTIPSCFLQGMGYPLAYPPWGLVLYLALKRSNKASNSTFRQLRSEPGKTVYTWHLTGKSGPPSWLKSFHEQIGLHSFLMANSARLLPWRDVPWKAHNDNLISACAHDIKEGPVSKPAPVCGMCKQQFPKRKSLGTGKVAQSVLDAMTDKVSCLEINPSSGTGNNEYCGKNLTSKLYVGGPYECEGEMPQCKNLPSGICQKLLSKC